MTTHAHLDLWAGPCLIPDCPGSVRAAELAILAQLERDQART